MAGCPVAVRPRAFCLAASRPFRCGARAGVAAGPWVSGARQSAAGRTGAPADGRGCLDAAGPVRGHGGGPRCGIAGRVAGSGAGRHAAAGAHREGGHGLAVCRQCRRHGLSVSVAGGQPVAAAPCRPGTGVGLVAAAAERAGHLHVLHFRAAGRIIAVGHPYTSGTPAGWQLPALWQQDVDCRGRPCRDRQHRPPGAGPDRGRLGRHHARGGVSVAVSGAQVPAGRSEPRRGGCRAGRAKRHRGGGHLSADGAAWRHQLPAQLRRGQSSAPGAGRCGGLAGGRGKRRHGAGERGRARNPDRHRAVGGGTGLCGLLPCAGLRARASSGAFPGHEQPGGGTDPDHRACRHQAHAADPEKLRGRGPGAGAVVRAPDGRGGHGRDVDGAGTGA